MTEERITEHTDAQGNTHTTRVIKDGSSSGSGGGAKWVFLLILVAALAIGGYILAQGNAAEVAKDNAVADAANDVGEAAGNVGEAARDVADGVNGE